MSDVATKLITRPTGPPIKPPVETLGASDDNAVILRPVKIKWLLALIVIPHRDKIGLNPHQTLRGQMIPRRHAQGTAHTHLSRGLDQIHLGTLVGNQRRYHEDVGVHTVQILSLIHI